MDSNDFTAEQARRLSVQFAERLINQYGKTALDEALSVVSMLVELGREELISVWLGAALEISRRRRGGTDAADAA
jgi:hypothetical protein